MHLPDGFLTAPVLATTTAAALAGLAATSRGVFRTWRASGGAALAGAAAVFAAQAANFPTAAGVTAHVLGGALLGATFGAAPAIAVVLPVIVVQALLGDGGILALGANVLNMAVAAPLVAAAVARGGGPGRRAAGAFCGTAAAVLLCTIELLASGRGPAVALIEGMARFHAPVALLEAAAAAAWALVVRPTGAFALRPRRAAFAAACVLAGCAAFAATAPDGLETIAADLGFAASAR